MMAEPLLTVDGLEVAFATDKGLARVLDKVNISIDAGEIVGLVGESDVARQLLPALFWAYCLLIRHAFSTVLFALKVVIC